MKLLLIVLFSILSACSSTTVKNKSEAIPESCKNAANNFEKASDPQAEPYTPPTPTGEQKVDPYLKGCAVFALDIEVSGKFSNLRLIMADPSTPEIKDFAGQRVMTYVYKPVEAKIKNHVVVINIVPSIK